MGINIGGNFNNSGDFTYNENSQVNEGKIEDSKEFQELLKSVKEQNLKLSELNKSNSSDIVQGLLKKVGQIGLDKLKEYI